MVVNSCGDTMPGSVEWPGHVRSSSLILRLVAIFFHYVHFHPSLEENVCPISRILCDRATGRAGQGRFDEAILVMNPVIRTDSNNPSIWYNKGMDRGAQKKNCYI